MDSSNIISQTREGYRLCCPVCGLTHTVVNPGHPNPQQALQACCKRCQTPIASRNAIEQEIEHLCSGNKNTKWRIHEDVFKHIEIID